MKKINKRGFTLVEMLAAIVVLGIIMSMAVPNIMSVLNNSRNKTYVEDAKKLVALAEQKYRSDQSIIRTTTPGYGILIRLNYMDTSAFQKAPNGRPYDKDKSFVLIRSLSKNSSSGIVDEVHDVIYDYYVTLVDDDGKGIVMYSLNSLNTLKPSDLVTKGLTTSVGPAPSGDTTYNYTLTFDIKTHGIIVHSTVPLVAEYKGDTGSSSN